MNFEEFCSSNNEFDSNEKKDKFEKFNQNLQKNNKNNENNENLSQKSQIQQNFSNILNQNIDEEEIKEKMLKYQNMSQNELLTELVKETKKQKQNGNLSNQKLEEIKNSMSSILNDEQKSRLDDIIKMLR